MFEQVRFQIVNPDMTDIDNDIYGGIAEYTEIEDEKILLRVICGCCGGVFEPEDVKILERYSWVDISDEIMGD